MRVQYQVNCQGVETKVCRVERGECSTLSFPASVIPADLFRQLSRMMPSNVASTLLTTRTIHTSLKERRWLLLWRNPMDMRCQPSILPITPLPTGYVSFL